MEFHLTRKQAFIVLLLAGAGITLLEAVALLKGMNGAALTSSIGAIAALAGYAVGKRKKKE